MRVDAIGVEQRERCNQWSDLIAEDILLRQGQQVKTGRCPWNKKEGGCLHTKPQVDTTFRAPLHGHHLLPLPFPCRVTAKSLGWDIMATNAKLREIYAERMMKRHDYGYPLYEPALDTEIAPGRCGYLDHHGKWNPVADLAAKDDQLSKRGYTPLEADLEKAPVDQSIQWGPKFSESVSGRRVGLRAGVS